MHHINHVKQIIRMVLPALIALALAGCAAPPATKAAATPVPTTARYVSTYTVQGLAGSTPGSIVPTPDPNSLNIADLVGTGSLAAEVRDVTINSMSLSLTNTTSKALQVEIPAGTYFVAKNPSTQNMVVRHSASASVPAKDALTVDLDLACASLHRAAPTFVDTFSVVRAPQQADLATLMARLDNAGLSYAVEQAAVWIVSDNASYDELGMLVGESRSGPSLIRENEAGRALKLVSEAGLGIDQYALWQESSAWRQNVSETDVKDWLAKQPTHIGAGQGTQVPFATLAAGAGGQPVHEFASSANASSQLSSTDGSARRATGPHDATTCGDLSRAWASDQTNPGAVLTVRFDQAAIPQRVLIYEAANPGAIFMVNAIDTTGVPHNIYQTIPDSPAGAQPTSNCPHIMAIPVMVDITVPIIAVEITMDQSATGWTAIDAVELFGTAR